jgi:hypothetical protein
MIRQRCCIVLKGVDRYGGELLGSIPFLENEKNSKKTDLLEQEYETLIM